MSNFFDPGSLFGGGSSGGSSAAAGASGGMGAAGTLALLGNQGDQNQQKQPVVDTQKAYGFGPAGGDAGGDSQFNAMRKQQMGMGGPSGG